MARPDGEGEEAAETFVLALRTLGGALQRIPRGWACVAALLWAGLITYLSSRPPPALGRGGPISELFSNLAHAPEYGVLAVWLALAAPRKAGWPDLAPRTLVAILIGVAFYAVADELHQATIPNRDASAFDALTDLVGATATLACIAAAGAPRASSREVLLRVMLGLLACLLAASLSTFVPKLYPELSWL